MLPLPSSPSPPTSIRTRTRCLPRRRSPTSSRSRTERFLHSCIPLRPFSLPDLVFAPSLERLIALPIHGSLPHSLSSLRNKRRARSTRSGPHGALGKEELQQPVDLSPWTTNSRSPSPLQNADMFQRASTKILSSARAHLCALRLPSLPRHQSTLRRLPRTCGPTWLGWSSGVALLLAAGVGRTGARLHTAPG